MASKNPILNLNEATAAQLITAAGLAQELAEAILARRKEVGAFLSLDALEGVPGMNSAALERLRASVQVPRPVDAQLKPGPLGATGTDKGAPADNVTPIITPAGSGARPAIASAAPQVAAALQADAAALPRMTRRAEVEALEQGSRWLAWWSEQASDGMRVVIGMWRCRTPMDAMQLQSEFLRSSFDRFNRFMVAAAGAARSGPGASRASTGS